MGATWNAALLTSVGNAIGVEARAVHNTETDKSGKHGGEGWPEQAPFDRILVTAAAPGEPTALLAQLKPKGILVAPIGKGPVQQLQKYSADGNGGFKVETLCEVRFVPLLDGVAREL